MYSLFLVSDGGFWHHGVKSLWQLQLALGIFSVLSNASHWNFFTSPEIEEGTFVFFSATLGNYRFPFGWNKSNCNYTQNELLLRITKYKKAEKIKRKETWLINSYKINHILSLFLDKGKHFSRAVLSLTTQFASVTESI